MRLGRAAQLLPIAVLAAAMALVAFNVVPVAIAFFGAAVVLLLLGSLSLREAYEAIEWPILIMLGALIPVSNALRTTGGTDLIASALCTMRFPHSDRASMQHAGDGSGRLSLWRLLAARPAAIDHRFDRRRDASPFSG